MEGFDTQVRDVYAEYGRAMGVAQLLEHYLVYLIIAAYEHPSSQKLTAEEYDDKLAQLSRKTLGGLISGLKQSFEVPPAFASRLEEALNLRNWLAHHYFADRAEAFQTPDGRSEMIRELDGIGNRLHKLFEYFDDLLVGWLMDPSPETRELIERFCRTSEEA